MSKRAKRPADRADTPASDRTIPRGTDEHSKSSKQRDDERTAAKPPHVDSEDQATRAVSAAKKVQGVRSVKNDIRLKR